ncbi:MAG: BCD family MFS transporter [Okeania sp. SIO3B5]|uniref:BCD family MFS transporter n=1 Tax=Okeania sp. SIO3B5 TaxID=2607811 RepID=UPI0013FF649D|nr:BCD family MFS transporter [Okeania sp. SIO3B5]NEO54216.1 BCD family MFS transporter [Okeania sp. SIO3B5]
MTIKDSSSPLKFIKLIQENFLFFRLGLYQMGLGTMSVLTLGVLNRVMITELTIPATIVAFTLSLYQFMAPARVWFGQMSDVKPLFGQHRTGYMWIGAVLFTLTAFIAVQVMWQVGDSLEVNGWTNPTFFWVGMLGLMFIIYGLALSASSTPFAALLVDISDEDNRSKVVGIVWSMLMVGIIIGAITSSVLLKQVGVGAQLETVKASVNSLFIKVPAIVLILAFISTVGVEQKHSRYRTRSTIANREDKVTLGTTLKVLRASRQTGLFFTFVFVLIISLFMQDAVLEPYGGEIFSMPISETTRLNAVSGMGTLIGLGTTGFLVVPRLGKKNSLKVGCVATTISFILIVMSGFTGNPSLFKGALFLYGLAAGLTTTASLSLMLDLTVAETAGTFIGAWGLAQAMARGLSTVIGGASLDLGRLLFNIPMLAYGLVFLMAGIGMILSIFLLNRVNVREFQDNSKQAIATILEGELD